MQIKRFDLKRIVEVRIAAAEPQHQRTQQICRDKERSPASILSHMDVFVISSVIQVVWSPSENRVA